MVPPMTVEEMFERHAIKQRTRAKYGSITKRSDVVCAKCGSKSFLEYHHNSISYHRDKFVILCHDCHQDEHRKLIAGKGEFHEELAVPDEKGVRRETAYNKRGVRKNEKNAM